MRTVASLLTTAALVLPGAACTAEDRATGTAADTSSPDRSSVAVLAADSAERLAPSGRRVLAISVDGLNPAALRRLGPDRAPTYHLLEQQGAGTRNARTARELTKTLPNHTSMVTGRRVDRTRGGHGVTWNVDLPRRTVQGAAGHRVASVFTVVDRAGGSTALFAGKSKLSLFPRSWPQAVDRYTFDEVESELVRKTKRDLVRRSRELTFLHLALPDTTGHEHGFMSRRYLDAVARTDALIGRLVRTVQADPELRREVAVVLTSDHGGLGTGHNDATRLADYRVPFVVWGAGTMRGDLYQLNPTRRDPGTRRTSYADRRQPVRNGDLANVVTDILGLRPVPGSELNDGHDLDVMR